MKKKLLVASVLVLTLLTTGCKKVPKLENGKEVVAEIDGKQFTAEDFYERLKEQNGTGILVDMVDNFIVDKEIEDKKEAEEYAKNYLSSLKLQYQNSGQDFTQVLLSNGYSSENAFLNDIKSNYLRNKVAEKYVAKEIKDDEIKEYYDKEIFGELTARHILVSPEVTSTMTDEEKTKAEEAALEKAKKLIEQLDKGAKFEELAKENSDDDGTASEGGLLSDFKKSDVVEEFWNGTFALKDGEYTKEPVKSQFGYHIILRVSEKERPKLEDVKDDIIDELVDDKFNKDNNLSAKTWIDIRKKYNLSIVETTIKNTYDATVSSYGK